MQISLGNDNYNGNGKCNSRFPSGMTSKRRERRLVVDGDAQAWAAGVMDAPGDAWGVVCDADLALGGEEDDASVASEAVEEVVDGGLGGRLCGVAVGDAVGGPFAEDELHDGVRPSR